MRILLLLRRPPGALTMRQFTPKQLMVPAVIGLTLVHLGVRWSGRGDGQPHEVSPLGKGAHVALKRLKVQVLGFSHSQ